MIRCVCEAKQFRTASPGHACTCVLETGGANMVELSLGELSHVHASRCIRLLSSSKRAQYL